MKRETGTLGLNCYDYGARFYNPQLGRWHVVDPLVKDTYDWIQLRFISHKTHPNEY